MVRVYLLWHSRENGFGDSDEKLIGVYSTKQRAEASLERARLLPGFRDHPDTFEIATYRVDEDHWVEGFTTT
ncbi:MAG TPA: hypothetical protein VD860_06130 [Azospirillum sp.]|nr:hypothetical protein [Azospirillum sp.]